MRPLIPIAFETDTKISSEDELASAALANPAAFQALYDRWVMRVYQYLYFQTGRAPDAEDLTSAVFLAAYQALPRYRAQGQFGAWLFTIARNQARSYQRRRPREVDLELAGSISGGEDPQVAVARTDEIERLHRLVRSLPDDEQELIRLRYVADLSFTEMAVVLNRNVDAVKKSLYRLQDRLQRQWEVQND